MAGFRRKKQKVAAKKMALEQIGKYFTLCEKFADPSLQKKYIDKIWQLATHHRIRLPSVSKRRFCRQCHSYFVHGLNCRVRLQKDHIVLYCLVCKHHRRFVHKS